MKIGMKILFVSRKSERCGVADYGRRVFNVLKQRFDIELREVEGETNTDDYELVIWNYHFATLPWVVTKISQLRTNDHIMIYHEGPMLWTPNVTINTDSTISEQSRMFSSPRPLFENISFVDKENDIPTIGSFGFGFADKAYWRIAEMVSKEFDRALIRLNIPFAEFGDMTGEVAKKEVEKVRQYLKPGIELQVSHEFLSQADLLNFLHGNDINLFLYDPLEARGLSSTIDYALSVKKPIGISMSSMFRHLPRGICVDDSSIKEVMSKGIELLIPVYEQHSNENLLNKYERVINSLKRKHLTH